MRVFSISTRSGTLLFSIARNAFSTSFAADRVKRNMSVMGFTRYTPSEVGEIATHFPLRVSIRECTLAGCHESRVLPDYLRTLDRKRRIVFARRLWLRHRVENLIQSLG
jgi:hypothetical protein